MSGPDKAFYAKLERVIYVVGLGLLFVAASYLVTNHGRTDDSFLIWASVLVAIGMAIRVVVMRKARA
jgi:hypothetical protein